MTGPGNEVIVCHPWSARSAGASADGDAADLTAIFFEAAARKSFVDDAERAAFHWRWLGQYLDREPELAMVARGQGGDVRGYAVASRLDPVNLPAFREVPAVGLFADLSAASPAHLHINVAAIARGQGVGAALIEALVAELRRHGVAGMHVVTDAASRNVGFYARAGFAEVARRRLGERDLVFLVRII